MPRTANRKVNYTIEIDTDQIGAIGGRIYHQYSDVQGALSLIGDIGLVVMGNIEELWPENNDRAKVAFKKAFINFIETADDFGVYPMYSVSQKTGDFSSWDVTIDLRYLP